MKILFDHGTPRSIGRSLIGHQVTRAAQMGWHEVENGELIDRAEKAGYELLLGTDKNIRYQQNLANRKIAIVVLTDQQWPNVRLYLGRIAQAVDTATAGSYTEVKFRLRPRSCSIAINP